MNQMWHTFQITIDRLRFQDTKHGRWSVSFIGFFFVHFWSLCFHMDIFTKLDAYKILGLQIVYFNLGARLYAQKTWGGKTGSIQNYFPNLFECLETHVPNNCNGNSRCSSLIEDFQIWGHVLHLLRQISQYHFYVCLRFYSNN